MKNTRDSLIGYNKVLVFLKKIIYRLDMYLSKLRLWNFRKYSEGHDGNPGLEVHFHNGLNALVGENDSGKTAIVDLCVKNAKR